MNPSPIEGTVLIGEFASLSMLFRIRANLFHMFRNKFVEIDLSIS